MSDGEPATTKSMVEFEHLLALDVRVGTVVGAEPNPKARVPAYVLEIDFGPLGTRRSSAQLTQNYEADALVGRQVVAVLNFPPKRVAGVKSELLVLGAVCDSNGVVLLAPDRSVANGTAIG